MVALKFPTGGMEGMVGGSPSDTRRATRVRKVAPKVAAVIIDRGTRQRVQINLLASVAVNESFRVASFWAFFHKKQDVWTSEIWEAYMFKAVFIRTYTHNHALTYHTNMYRYIHVYACLKITV